MARRRIKGAKDHRVLTHDRRCLLCAWKKDPLTTDLYPREDVGQLSSSETLFLRIASAAEGLVLAAILSVILPRWIHCRPKKSDQIHFSIFKKRKRTSFYPRLAIAYSLIVLIIIIRLTIGDDTQHQYFRIFHKCN